MFEKYKCTNIQCPNTESGKKGEDCPECGATLEKLTRNEASMVKTDKVTYQKEQLSNVDPESRTPEEKMENKDELAEISFPRPLGGYDKESHSGVVVTATQEGLEFETKKVFSKEDSGTQLVRYPDITSINYKKGLVLGDVIIVTPKREIKIRNVPSNEGNRFVPAVQKIMQFK